MSTNIDGSQSNFLPTMLLPIRLYPAKYHFMPTQGQIQEVEIFLLQDTFNMGILCYKTSLRFPVFILKMQKEK